MSLTLFVFQGAPLAFSFAFASLSPAIVANSPCVPISPILPLSKGPLLPSHLHWPLTNRRFWLIRHFCHIHQFRQIRHFPRGPLFPSHLHLPPTNRRFWQIRRFPRGPSCLLICICLPLAGDFGKFAKFTHFPKGPFFPSHLHLPPTRRRFWRIRHFRHIHRFPPLLPSKLLAILANLPFFATFPLEYTYFTNWWRNFVKFAIFIVIINNK